MNPLLKLLDHNQLITIIDSICGNVGITILQGEDPDDYKPILFAAPKPTVIGSGTFTVLNLDAPLLRTYRVTCFSHSVSELTFHVTAPSSEMAIEIAAQRTDGFTDVEPIREDFLETTDEKGWRSEPLDG